MMRITTSIIILLFVHSTQVFAQIISFQDTAFEQCLLRDTNINKNLDAYIDKSEAESAVALSCVRFAIFNLSGIEYFKNIKELELQVSNFHEIDFNFASKLKQINLLGNLDSPSLQTKLDFDSISQLEGLYLSHMRWDTPRFDNLSFLETLVVDNGVSVSKLDLSQNDSLTYVSISNGEIDSILFKDSMKINTLIVRNCSLNKLNIEALTYLDILDLKSNALEKVTIESPHNYLTRVDVSGNSLSSFDLSLLPNLERVNLDNNFLVELDASSNESLSLFEVNKNDLKTLNLANGNNKFLSLDLRNNPKLACVTVDDSVFSSDNWALDADPNVIFSTSCSRLLSSRDVSIEQTHNIWYDPQNFNIIYKGADGEVRFYLYNSAGVLVDTVNGTKLNLSERTSGVYFVRVLSIDGSVHELRFVHNVLWSK